MMTMMTMTTAMGFRGMMTMALPTAVAMKMARSAAVVMMATMILVVAVMMTATKTRRTTTATTLEATTRTLR